MKEGYESERSTCSRQPVPILVFVVGYEGTKTASEEKAKSWEKCRRSGRMDPSHLVCKP